MLYPKTTHTALASLQRALTPEDLWAASNELLRAAMPVYHTLIGLPCLGTMPMFLRTTLPVENQDDYFVRLNAVAPIGPMLAANPGAPVLRMSDNLPAHILPGLPFYEHFMKPEGWRYSAGLMFWSATGEFIGQLSLIRTEAQGDITDDEVTLLKSLHPVVNAAVERLLAAEKRAAAHSSLEHSVDSLPLPLAGVDWDLAVNYTNQAGSDALTAWRLGSQAARALKPETAPALSDDLRAMCEQLKAEWQAAVLNNTLDGMQRIRLLARAGEPGFQAAVQLVEPELGRSLQPAFVIQFSVSRNDPAETGRALTELSKLTSTEREVARLAASGHDNADIVRELGVSESTVRTHLRAIFRKLGITSRGKLAPLYRSLQTADGR